MFYILAKNMQNVLITLAKMPPTLKQIFTIQFCLESFLQKRTKQQQTKMFIKPQPMMAVYREKKNNKVAKFY